MNPSSNQSLSRGTAVGGLSAVVSEIPREFDRLTNAVDAVYSRFELLSDKIKPIRGESPKKPSASPESQPPSSSIARGLREKSDSLYRLADLINEVMDEISL